MAEAMTIRVRHYTRRSSKERILTEGRLVARDQNRVFVERADRKALSAREAEAKYLLRRGKGNAYVEFNAEEEEIDQQKNHRTGEMELFLFGDVDITGRDPQGFDNG
jgi:hypothetical protein